MSDRDAFRAEQQAADTSTACVLLVPPNLLGGPQACRPYGVEPAVFDSWVRCGIWIAEVPDGE